MLWMSPGGIIEASLLDVFIWKGEMQSLGVTAEVSLGEGRSWECDIVS